MPGVSILTTHRQPWLQAVKTCVAAGLAWVACLFFFPGTPPIFAAIAALMCVQSNMTQSLSKGIERVVGVVGGVAISFAAIAVWGTPSWLFIAAIMLSVFLGWFFKMNSSSTNQIAITSILVLSLGAATTEIAIERIVETLIGAAIGIAVNAIIVAPVTTNPAHIAIRTLGYGASRALDNIAMALSEPQHPTWIDSMLDDVRLLSQEREEVRGLVASARESLKLNPRSSKHSGQLSTDEALLHRLSPIVTQVIGMTRALHDNYSSSLTDDPTVHGMAEEFRRAAHDLRRFSKIREELNEELLPITSPLPALTSPFAIIRPNPEHWILIGSLMEDLRRVRDGILALEKDD